MNETDTRNRAAIYDAQMKRINDWIDDASDRMSRIEARLDAIDARYVAMACDIRQGFAGIRRDLARIDAHMCEAGATQRSVDQAGEIAELRAALNDALRRIEALERDRNG